MIQHNAVPVIETSKMFYMCRETLSRIAAQAIADSATAAVEMILDTPPDEYTTKEEIDEVLAGLRDQAAEFMLETINDLRTVLISQIYSADFTATVRALKYTPDGVLNDIDVDVVFAE